MIGKGHAELREKDFLLGGGFGDAAQPDLATVRGGQDDGGALQSGEQRESSHSRKRLGVSDSADGWLRDEGAPPLQQMFERDPTTRSEEGDHYVGLDARLQLMEQGPDRQFALQRPERRLGLNCMYRLQSSSAVPPAMLVRNI